MSHYRDHLDAARARIETLEAKLKERDAALAARDAEIAEIRAEVERLRGGSDDDGPPDGPLGRGGGQRALLVALAVCSFATATGYAMVRPSHCLQRGGAYPLSAEVSLRSQEGYDAWSSRVDGARVRVSKAAGAALEHGRVRAKRCWQPGGPSGEGSVTVTFAPSGEAHVALDGAPFAGTEVGACVVDAFQGAAARVPAFEGEPLRLTTPISL
ncbi:hypothetical protein WMF27_36645 [Sorangium sp. So ce281]|uniref:hypothetical protein n=1 Tax=unclassified Sorangium TaxID=2621164 RepID=UPI003F5F38A9